MRHDHQLKTLILPEEVEEMHMVEPFDEKELSHRIWFEEHSEIAAFENSLTRSESETPKIELKNIKVEVIRKQS